MSPTPEPYYFIPLVRVISIPDGIAAVNRSMMVVRVCDGVRSSDMPLGHVRVQGINKVAIPDTLVVEEAKLFRPAACMHCHGKLRTALACVKCAAYVTCSLKCKREAAAAHRAYCCEHIDATTVVDGGAVHALVDACIKVTRTDIRFSEFCGVNSDMLRSVDANSLILLACCNRATPAKPKKPA